MTGPLSGQDEDTWARAVAMLDRLPPEPPEKRDRRLVLQRRQWGLAAGLLVATVALWAAVAVADGGLTGPREVPGWRTAARFIVLAAGSGAVLVGSWMHARSVRHMQVGDRPLDWLTGSERRALLRAARTGQPLVGQQLRMARHVAAGRLAMELTPAYVPGYLFALSGLVFADPHPLWYGTLVLLVIAATAWLVHQRRDARRLRRFLDEHPDPTGGQCTNRRGGRSPGPARGRCA